MSSILDFFNEWWSQNYKSCRGWKYKKTALKAMEAGFGFGIVSGESDRLDLLMGKYQNFTVAFREDGGVVVLRGGQLVEFNTVDDFNKWVRGY